jgi:hypothetical protein
MCALLLVVALGAALWATQQAVGLPMFGALLIALASLILTLLLSVWTYGFYTLRYELDDEGVTIHWLFLKERLSYQTVDAVYSGQRMSEALHVRGITWPGYYVGRGRARNLGVLRVFATTLVRSELTILLTELGTYVLSPDAPFRNALVERLQHGGERAGRLAGQSQLHQPRHLGRAVADPWLLAGALASLAVVLGMLGYIMDRYETLPELLALQFDANGEPSFIRPRFDLFHLPSIGATVLLTDVLAGIWIYQREPLAARMLWVAPLLIQGVLGLAVIRTIG